MLGGGAHAHIDLECRSCRHRIAGRARDRKRRSHRGAEFGVRERRDRQHLVGKLDRGVDPFLGLEAGVGSRTGHHNLIERYALAFEFQRPTVGRGLEYERGSRPGGRVFDQLSRVWRAELFVARHEQRHAVAIFERSNRVHRHRQAGLHVEASGPGEHTVAHGIRQPVDCAKRPHGVVVSQ